MAGAAEGKGYATVVLVDVPDPTSLRGTGLQSTVTRVSRKLENLCNWHGAKYAEFGNGGRRGVSGQCCPLCGRKMRLVDRGSGRRVYHCNSCNLTADRDFAACWNMTLKYLKNGRGAVRPLLRRLGPRALGARPGWPLSPD